MAGFPKWIKDEAGLRSLAMTADTSYGQSLLFAAEQRRDQLRGLVEADPRPIDSPPMAEQVAEIRALNWMLKRPAEGKKILNKYAAQESA